MFRGSRLGASFLLLLTGGAALALGLLVLPGRTGAGVPPVAVVLAIAFAFAHGVAIGGIVAARDWGRNLAVFIAEFGGGLAIVGIVAAALGASPLGAAVSDAVAFLAWTTAMYALLGIAAGRIPVVGRLSGIARQRAVLGPGFGYESILPLAA